MHLLSIKLSLFVLLNSILQLPDTSDSPSLLRRSLPPPDILHMPKHDIDYLLRTATAWTSGRPTLLEKLRLATVRASSFPFTIFPSNHADIPVFYSICSPFLSKYVLLFSRPHLSVVVVCNPLFSSSRYLFVILVSGEVYL